MARLYKGQSVPTKVGTYQSPSRSRRACRATLGTYREQEPSSIDATESSMACRATLGTHKNAACKGGIFVPAQGRTGSSSNAARYCLSGITRISTRRFCARPASVLLSAIG